MGLRSDIHAVQSPENMNGWNASEMPETYTGNFMG